MANPTTGDQRAGRGTQFAGREQWSCVRCGICLEACPTYRLTRDEGWSPRGRVNLVRALAGDLGPIGEAEPPSATSEPAPRVIPPDLHWRALVREGRTLLEACLLCRACEAACPSQVRYGWMMMEARAWLAEQRPGPATGRLRRLLRTVAPRPWWVRLYLAWLRFGVRMHWLDLRVRLSSPPAHRAHFLALLESLRARTAEPDLTPVPVPAGARCAGEAVLLFRGCLTPSLYPAVPAALRSLLGKLAIESSTPRRQTCCGALHRAHGLLEEARALARRNIDAFESAGEGPVLVVSSSCTAALREYGELLAGDEQYAARAQAFSARVEDAAEYMAARVESWTTSQPPATGPLLQIQTPCQLRHVGGGTALGRLLARLGFEPAPDAPGECCGGPGLYSLLQPGTSAQLADRAVDRLAAGGARLVVTSDTGCRVQLQGRLARRGVGMAHVLELWDRCWK